MYVIKYRSKLWDSFAGSLRGRTDLQPCGSGRVSRFLSDPGPGPEPDPPGISGERRLAGGTGPDQRICVR